jgi:hypothetical protein
MEPTGIEPVTSGLQRRCGLGQRRSGHGSYRVRARCSGTVGLRGSGVPDKTPDKVARTEKDSNLRLRPSNLRLRPPLDALAEVDYANCSTPSKMFLTSFNDLWRPQLTRGG